MEDHPQIALIEAQLDREFHSRFTSVIQLDDWGDAASEIDVWRPDDEQEYRDRLASLNGRRVRLLVPHPFKGENWEVIAPAEAKAPTDGPGWYVCRCVSRYDCNGVAYYAHFPQPFHRSEFEVIE